MKKIIIILAIIIALLVYKSSKEDIRIPASAIRFRILANSNTAKDQQIKENVKNELQKEMYNVLKDSSSIDESRIIINNNMDNFSNVISKKMVDIPYSFKIDYGMHRFPEKIYKGITYEEGDYESLLVTLGEGKGDNFWCVLFPPLCIMEATETQTDEIEYKSFVKELIQKYF